MLAHDEREKYLIRYAGDFAPFVVKKASGAWAETTDGELILDFTSGQISSSLGHNHPRIVGATKRSLDEVVHLNSWMVTEDVQTLTHLDQGVLQPVSTGAKGLPLRRAEADHRGVAFLTLALNWRAS